jgi:hypothetical protein
MVDEQKPREWGTSFSIIRRPPKVADALKIKPNGEILGVKVLIAVLAWYYSKTAEHRRG